MTFQESEKETLQEPIQIHEEQIKRDLDEQTSEVVNQEKVRPLPPKRKRGLDLREALFGKREEAKFIEENVVEPIETSKSLEEDAIQMTFLRKLPNTVESCN